MIRRVYDGVVRALACVAFSVMLGAALVGTVSRYLPFMPSISWSEEVTRFAGIWAVFFVAGLGIRKGAHLGVDMLTGRLPRPVRQASQVVVFFLMLAFCLLLLVSGVRLAAENTEQYSAALEWPMGWVYLCIPTGAALMIVEIVAILWRLLHGLPPPAPPVEEIVE
jgi:C4-dicarboxylate transporter DctQ subunit